MLNYYPPMDCMLFLVQLTEHSCTIHTLKVQAYRTEEVPYYHGNDTHHNAEYVFTVCAAYTQLAV